MILIVTFGITRLQPVAGEVEATPVEISYREIVNNSFGPGEYLRFSVGYGFLTAGEATLEVRDTNTYKGFLCFQLYSETRSNNFFDSFYKVRDTVTSQLDVDGLFSHYFRRALHEGSYHSQREILFEHNQRRAIARKGESEIDTINIEPFSQDVMTSLYYVRTLPLEVGKSVLIPSVSGKKAETLEVRVLKRETVKVPAGVFDCLVVEPLLTEAGIFKQEGEVKVWLTDDRLRMPVLMKSKVLVGSIHAELTEFRLGNLNW